MSEGVLKILSCGGGGGGGEDISHVQGYKYCPWGGGGGGEESYKSCPGGCYKSCPGGGGGGGNDVQGGTRGVI